MRSLTRIRAKRSPFPKNSPETETWYDLERDRDLIIQSIAKQYGITPSDQEELHYSEWLLLVGGLMEDTPLGRIVLIRREEDKERLKHFTKYEHRIRNEWRNFRAKQKMKVENKRPEEYAGVFEKMFAKMFR